MWPVGTILDSVALEWLSLLGEKKMCFFPVCHISSSPWSIADMTVLEATASPQSHSQAFLHS